VEVIGIHILVLIITLVILTELVEIMVGIFTQDLPVKLLLPAGTAVMAIAL